MGDCGVNLLVYIMFAHLFLSFLRIPSPGSPLLPQVLLKFASIPAFESIIPNGDLFFFPVDNTSKSDPVFTLLRQQVVTAATTQLNHNKERYIHVSLIF